MVNEHFAVGLHFLFHTSLANKKVWLKPLIFPVRPLFSDVATFPGLRHLVGVYNVIITDEKNGQKI